jgi:predicted MFS family arabinose efflux permease
VELREGAAFVVRHPLLRPVLLTAIVFNTAWFLLQAVYVAYAVERLALTAGEVGLTLASYGVGMVSAATLAPRLGRRISVGMTIGSGPACALLASATMLATLEFPNIWLPITSFFLFGAGPTLWVISTTTLRQSVTPGAMLGRVSAIIVTVTFGARPVGAAIGTFLAAKFGVETCLLASTAGFLTQFGILFASPVPRLSRLPEAA